MAAHQFVPFVFLATPEVSAALSLEYMAKSSHAWDLAKIFMHL